MLKGMLAWAFMYAAFALIVPFASTPAHPLPAYALFLACLLPWALWLAATVAKRGGAEPASLVVAVSTVLAFTYPVQILATHRRDWEYFQDRDVLLGFRLGGVPLEEYFFYPLTLSLALLLYLQACERIRAKRLPDLRVPRGRLRELLLGGSAACFAACLWALLRPVDGTPAPDARGWDALGIPHFSAGARDYGWTVTCLVGLGCNLAALYLAELVTPMQLRAVLPATAVFVVVGFLVDLLGLSRGWWVMNARHASGVWLGPVPVENIGMYLCGVPETVAVFEGCRRLFGERGTA